MNAWRRCFWESCCICHFPFVILAIVRRALLSCSALSSHSERERGMKSWVCCGHVLAWILRCKMTTPLLTQFRRDLLVWNHKTLYKYPPFQKGDKTIIDFRKWYSQFFSENSPTWQDYRDRTLQWWRRRQPRVSAYAFPVPTPSCAYRPVCVAVSQPHDTSQPHRPTLKLHPYKRYFCRSFTQCSPDAVASGVVQVPKKIKPNVIRSAFWILERVPITSPIGEKEPRSGYCWENGTSGCIHVVALIT